MGAENKQLEDYYKSLADEYCQQLGEDACRPSRSRSASWSELDCRRDHCRDLACNWTLFHGCRRKNGLRRMLFDNHKAVLAAGERYKETKARKLQRAKQRAKDEEDTQKEDEKTIAAMRERARRGELQRREAREKERQEEKKEDLIRRKAIQ